MGSDKQEVAVAAAPATDVTGEKQGAKCCGCCCDFRRAVIVLAIIGLVYYSVMCVLAIIGASFAGSQIGAYDDDYISGLYLAGSVAGGVVAAILAVGVLFSIFKLCAALKYNVCMLVTCLVVDLINLAFSIAQPFTSETVDATTGFPRPYTSAEAATSVILSIVFAGLFMYPTIGLVMEIKKGIMSQETYPREAYSCCCQPNV